MLSGSLENQNHSDYIICHTNWSTSVSKEIIMLGQRTQIDLFWETRVNGFLPELTDRHYFINCVFTISSLLSPNSETFILNNS